MQHKWLKRTLSVFVFATPICIILFHFFKVEIHSLFWQPMPQVDTAVGERIVYEEKYNDSITVADNILQHKLEALGVPGLSISVGLNGKTIWAGGFGYSDVENKTPMTIDSQFRIGSTSKALTSLVLGKLLEQEKIALDTPISKYLAGLPDPLKHVTIRQLASHQSGIRNYSDCWCFPHSEYFANDEVKTVNNALNAFIYDPLLFQPGEKFAYSTYNFTLLSAVLTKAAKKPFKELIDETVFTPLNMFHTVTEHHNANIPNQVSFYNTGYGHYQKAFTVNNSNKWAGGGLVSTPMDLVRMSNRLLVGEHLNQETLNVLFTPQKLNDGTTNHQNYALGWRYSFDEERNLSYVHHGGRAVGSTSFLVLFPEQKMAISILTNASLVESTQFWDMLFDVADVFLKGS